MLKKCKNLTYLLKENIEYLKNTYGTEYLKPLIIIIDKKKIENIFPYLQELEVLPTVINSASILTLSLDEIKERKKVLDYIGESMVTSNKFNSIFGLSKKNYQKKLASINMESQSKGRKAA